MAHVKWECQSYCIYLQIPKEKVLWEHPKTDWRDFSRVMPLQGYRDIRRSRDARPDYSSRLCRIDSNRPICLSPKDHTGALWWAPENDSDQCIDALYQLSSLDFF